MSDRWDNWQPLDEPPRASVKNGATGSRFKLEPWSNIAFDGREEWLVKRLLPRVGTVSFYGRPGSFKSFLVSSIALHVALGWRWGNRKVHQAPVIYIASEGAAGLRKRKAGFQIAHPEVPTDLPFYLIAAAPNLGAEKGDLPALIAAIEAAGIVPGAIVLDTLAASLGAGDENGAGMTAFVGNATALAAHFQCLVTVVHHSGLSDDKRLRGHSSLLGALDAAVLCERVEGDLAATLTLVKNKDDASDVKLRANLSRVVLGFDEDGDEISTLVVDQVEPIEATAPTPKVRPVPPSQRLLMACVTDAIDDAGESFRPFGTKGPLVRGVDEARIRKKYFARIAEKAEADEDPEKLFDRQRKGFKRSLEAALKAESLMATDYQGERRLWLPS